MTAAILTPQWGGASFTMHNSEEFKGHAFCLYAFFSLFIRIATVRTMPVVKVHNYELLGGGALCLIDQLIDQSTECRS